MEYEGEGESRRGGRNRSGGGGEYYSKAKCVK
jgi:hypothetical protein